MARLGRWDRLSQHLLDRDFTPLLDQLASLEIPLAMPYRKICRSVRTLSPEEEELPLDFYWWRSTRQRWRYVPVVSSWPDRCLHLANDIQLWFIILVRNKDGINMSVQQLLATSELMEFILYSAWSFWLFWVERCTFTGKKSKIKSLATRSVWLKRKIYCTRLWFDE